jgi:hypothetical protein
MTVTDTRNQAGGLEAKLWNHTDAELLTQITEQAASYGLPVDAYLKELFTRAIEQHEWVMANIVGLHHLIGA